MDILIVDHVAGELEMIRTVVQEKYPGSIINIFAHPMLAVKYGANHPVDILVTKRDMPMCDGYQVADLLKKFNESLTIYFINKVNDSLNDNVILRFEKF